jgi:uncharacterized protein YcbK (DUF882 family)
MDAQLTPHFRMSEANTTNTGLPNEIPENLMINVMRTLTMAEAFRAILGAPLKVNSLYRSPAVNSAVHGSGSKPGQLPSAHMDGRAIDFVPVGLDLEEAFQKLAKCLLFDKLILEGSGGPWES